MNYFRSTLVAVAIASLPHWATAAPIDFDAAGYELATGADKSVTVIADGLGVAGATLLFSDLFLFDDVTLTGFGSINVMDAAKYALAFDADGFSTDTANASDGGTDVSLMDGAIEALFESFTGTGVFAGVDALLVTFTSAKLVLGGSNGYFDFSDADGDTSTLRVQGLNDVAPIPLPAGLPLMISVMACFAWVKRRNKA